MYYVIYHEIGLLICMLHRRKTLETTLKEWETDDSSVDVVCATVAFGLGYLITLFLLPLSLTS